MKKTFIFSTLVFFVLVSTAHAGFGVKCTGYLKGPKKVICGNKQLISLDMEMANIYKEIYVREKGDDKKGFVDDQLQWLINRDWCASVYNKKEPVNICMKKRYTERISYLKSRLKYTKEIIIEKNDKKIINDILKEKNNLHPDEYIKVAPKTYLVIVSDTGMRYQGIYAIDTSTETISHLVTGSVKFDHKESTKYGKWYLISYGYMASQIMEGGYSVVFYDKKRDKIDVFGPFGSYAIACGSEEVFNETTREIKDVNKDGAKDIVIYEPESVCSSKKVKVIKLIYIKGSFKKVVSFQ